jgi:hypothetical protein
MLRSILGPQDDKVGRMILGNWRATKLPDYPSTAEWVVYVLRPLSCKFQDWSMTRGVILVMNFAVDTVFATPQNFRSCYMEWRQGLTARRRQTRCVPVQGEIAGGGKSRIWASYNRLHTSIGYTSIIQSANVLSVPHWPPIIRREADSRERNICAPDHPQGSSTLPCSYAKS